MPRCTAVVGTVSTPGSVSTCSRTLANWLGNRLPSALAKVALALMVPVVVSMALSTVSSRPVASRAFWSRSNSSTGMAAPARSRATTRGRATSGIENSAWIGCTWVMVTMPVVSAARTTLPRSAWRSPSRPEMGAVTRV